MKIRLTMWIACLAVAFATTGCVTPVEHNLPPAERLRHPGPGVDGPGPGVIPPMGGSPGMMGGSPGMMGPSGGMAFGGMVGPGGIIGGCDANGNPLGLNRGSTNVQVLFAKPEGMQVQWDVSAQCAFDSTPLVVPGRHNFPQGAIYRLKVTNIQGRPGDERYPTLEIGATTPRTEAYLAHNAIPVQFTDEDFDQVATGNFVTKVIYLPDPEFQELALAGVDTLVSTRLDPGTDPITEADRRGAILAVIRLGNKDVELPGSNGDGAAMIPVAQHNQSIAPASFNNHMNAMPGAVPMGMGPATMGISGLIPNHVAGVTSPEWGMPYTGTPIGLPGPPHLPFGGPAGLKSHTIKNHTRIHYPDPTHHMKIHVKQQPGYSYPRAPSRASIHEQMIHPSLPFNQPHYYRHEMINSGQHH